MAHKPTLLAWLDGMPEVENLYPLLALLHRRGHVQVRALLPRNVIRGQPRLSQAFAANGLVPRIASRYRVKYFTASDIAAADAVVGLSDPAHDRSAKVKRSERVRASGLPAIFLQHGALQMGVNVPWPDTPPMDYAAKLLLLWHPGAAEAQVLAQGTLSRAAKTGFTKAPVLPARQQPPALRDWCGRYDKRLLICHSFRWGHGRFGADEIRGFYDMLSAFLAQHRQIGVILRGHRGKVRGEHAAHDKDLEAENPSLLISRDKSGPLKGASMLDCLALCHALATPESTTVLDAIYADRPVALLDEPRLFTELPRITDAAALADFANAPEISAPACAAIRAAYGGTFDNNLARAAEAIEMAMLGH